MAEEKDLEGMPRPKGMGRELWEIHLKNQQRIKKEKEEQKAKDKSLLDSAAMLDAINEAAGKGTKLLPPVIAARTTKMAAETAAAAGVSSVDPAKSLADAKTSKILDTAGKTTDREEQRSSSIFFGGLADGGFPRKGDASRGDKPTTSSPGAAGDAAPKAGFWRNPFLPTPEEKERQGKAEQQHREGGADAGPLGKLSRGMEWLAGHMGGGDKDKGLDKLISGLLLGGRGHGGGGHGRHGGRGGHGGGHLGHGEEGGGEGEDVKIAAALGGGGTKGLVSVAGGTVGAAMGAVLAKGKDMLRAGFIDGPMGLAQGVAGAGRDQRFGAMGASAFGGAERTLDAMSRVAMDPFSQAAFKAASALAGLGKQAFATFQAFRDWTGGLHDANMQFAKYSSSMAQVEARQEVRQIQLERERGNRRAETAEQLASAMNSLDRTLAPVEDYWGNQFNKFGAWALKTAEANVISMSRHLFGVDLKKAKKEQLDNDGLGREMTEHGQRRGWMQTYGRDGHPRQPKQME